MTTDITELAPAMKAAAEKYRLTLEAHRNNPRDYDTVAAWDEATSEFMELVDSDELNIISGLVEALETQGVEIEWMRKRIEGLTKELEVSEERRVKWFQMSQALGEKLDGAEQHKAELEREQAKSIERGNTSCELYGEVIELRERIIETNDVLCNLLPDCRYMDPPDGGSVTPLEQVSRMIADYRQLEHFRTAYMEWSDKTDWVQTDKRFDVLKPLGKHRADVLKAYIEHLESRTDTRAAADVLAERQRQVTAEGWTAAHDDEYQHCEMAVAAACYIMADDDPRADVPELWPWPPEWWKPTNIRRDLVKAGALILAEIERIDRAESRSKGRNQPGMVVAVHVDAGDFVKVKGQVFEVEETDFDDHDVTLWFIGGQALKCAAGCPIEVVTAPEEAE